MVEFPLFYLAFFIFGICLGSFSNVLIHRLPSEQSIVDPVWSYCPSCKNTLKWWMNIPLFSWVVLKFQCYFCKKPISPQYPLVELLVGLAFCGVYYRYGWSVTTLEYCVFSWGLITASTIDFHHYILPDVFTISGIILGLVGAYLSPERDFFEALWGFALGFGFLWGMAKVFFLLKGIEGMGGGDIKLIGWIGAYLGISSIPFTIFVSSFLGSVIGLIFIAISGKNMRTTGIPFGPFLSLGALIFLFFQPIDFLFF